MSVDVSLRHQLPGFALDVSFTSTGRLTALFGPSGCGKTTVVNAISGLLRPDHASISADGVTLVDTTTGQWLPAHRRRIGYVFQEARLLPHFTVGQNLSYGRWFTPISQRFGDPAHVIDLLGLDKLLQRKPSQLSGGEKQRVALGRAILQSPRLLLMDEPLAALDDGRKQEILPYIERLRDELAIRIIYVSHAASEVARLATDVVLMSHGRVVARGSPEAVMPALDRTDDRLGRDAGALIDMRVGQHDHGNGLTELHFTGGTARLAAELPGPGSMVRVHIRSADVMLATERPTAISALNIFEGHVRTIEDIGRAACNVTLQCGDDVILAQVTRYSAQRLGLAPGLKAYAIIKAMSVSAPTSRP